MAIQLGGEGYGELVFIRAYVGQIEVDKVYLGSEQVYTKAE